MFAPIAALALAAASAPAVSAWGGVGHWTVGYVAMNFLDDNAKAVVADLLKPTETLAYVSVWADIVRNSAAFSFSREYHFVDPLDTPPEKCNYDDDRDCKTSACIVGAIGNYTARATCNNGLPKQDRYEALKFLVHFIGDIAQPLHACGRERGGNDRIVNFDGNANSKLHAIWDTAIPEKYLKSQGLFVSGNDGASAKNYADHLMTKINGEYKDKLAGWLSNKSVFAVNQNRNSLAAIDWATDSNDFNCNTVWPAVDKDTTQDFGGKYYDDAAPVVNIQIAKAGYRLGNWINRMFARCASAPSSTTTTDAPVVGATTTVAPVAASTTTVAPVVAASTTTTVAPVVAASTTTTVAPVVAASTTTVASVVVARSTTTVAPVAGSTTTTVGPVVVVAATTTVGPAVYNPYGNAAETPAATPAPSPSDKLAYGPYSTPAATPADKPAYGAETPAATPADKPAYGEDESILSGAFKSASVSAAAVLAALAAML
ncbi:S1/P1 nuclease-domain-containing protein [Entophlyctis helioformis]|nr:S1/P1 nuclease-domain-containing protein [Entophlyctis helioformis]